MKSLVPALLFLAALGCGAATKAPSRKSPPSSVAAASAKLEKAPFARVALALRGCSSCSYCRSTIRQMMKSNSNTNSVRVGSGKVEILYPEPQILPLQKVIQGFLETGLHDIELVDILFDAEGIIRETDAGQLVFSLRKTNQTFPLKLSPNQPPPPKDQMIRLRTVVKGWDKEEPLFLILKYVL